MASILPPLPYEYTALEPIIDEQTMHLHHDKHHATYVSNLNVALENQTSLQVLPLEGLLQSLAKVPEAIRTAVKNNAGQHFAHSLYFEILTPGGAKAPSGDLVKAIDAAFGGFDKFKDQMAKVGATRFGSGWAWLAVGNDSGLKLYSTANADTPFDQGDTAILTMDVWEHAYYLKYQNRRPDYIAAYLGLINWDIVARKFALALGK